MKRILNILFILVIAISALGQSHHIQNTLQRTDWDINGMIGLDTGMDTFILKKHENRGRFAGTIMWFDDSVNFRCEYVSWSETGNDELPSVSGQYRILDSNKIEFTAKKLEYYPRKRKTQQLKPRKLVFFMKRISDTITLSKKDFSADIFIKSGVKIIGIAENTIQGAVIKTDTTLYYIDELDSWADNTLHKLITVTANLYKTPAPVFIQHGTTDIHQGMPVKDSTEYEKFKYQFILKKIVFIEK